MAAILSIFGHDSAPRGLGAARSSITPTIAIQPPSAPRSDTMEAKLVATLDAKLVTILDGPLAPGETVVAALACLESRTMHTRLANAKLANKFARRSSERRCGLLNFPADARGRAAIAGGQ